MSSTLPAQPQPSPSPAPAQPQPSPSPSPAGIKGLANENSWINCKCRGCNYKKYPAHEVPRVAKKIGIQGPQSTHPSKVVPAPPRWPQMH